MHGVLVLDRTGVFRGVVDTSAVNERAVDMVVLMLEDEGGA